MGTCIAVRGAAEVAHLGDFLPEGTLDFLELDQQKD
jgi:hypothetical protein